LTLDHPADASRKDLMSKGHRIGYVRVSTLDQNTERQLDGIELDRTFTDKASGKDTRRPQLQAALEYARDGDFFVVHSMDRLARNAEDLLRTVRELTGRGVTVEFIKNHLTFSGKADPMAKLMMTMLAAFGEFERDLIRERQREGIAIAKAKGVYKGRRKALNAEQTAELVECARSGMPKAELARSYGISRETLYQYLRSTI
jgi:DNA invertase Pin-like site-specific DNA recombinase